MTEECGNCRFWAKRSDHAGNGGGGYCRRYPPFAPSGLLVWAEGDGRQLASITNSNKYLNDAWPMTHQQSWCGEWQEAPKP